MDVFTDFSKLDEFQLEMVNSVRLWLRMLMVADITDATGHPIEAWA